MMNGIGNGPRMKRKQLFCSLKSKRGKLLLPGRLLRHVCVESVLILGTPEPRSTGIMQKT
jgi:hypothetical protein